MGKRMRHYAVSAIETFAEHSANLVFVLRINCEDAEAEEFLSIAIRDVLRGWYGHATYQEDDEVFCSTNLNRSGESPCISMNSYKEISEATFSEMISVASWFTRDIDDHRKKILCS